MSEQQGKSGKSGGGARLWIGTQVILSVVLAVVAVQLINYLVARPGMRLRLDTTAKEINSLDPSTTKILENLPDDVTVDIFFRAEIEPFTRIVSQVQSRTVGLLERMALISGRRLTVRQNDLGDFDAIQLRKQELRLRGLENCVVVSSGDAVQVVRLSGGLADINRGNPDPNNFIPPSVSSFDAEINILKALLSVTRGERPPIYFTTGHGEADPFEDGQTNLGTLETALRVDGFARHTWHPLEDGDLPEEAFVVAVVGPTDPLSKDTKERLTSFLAEGGRLLIAPHPEEKYLQNSGLIEWVAEMGIEISAGTVMEPFPDPSGSGALITGQRSSSFPILPSSLNRHEIMQPFIDTGRYFFASRSHSVRVTRQPDSSRGPGLSMALFSSNKKISWLDTVPLNYRHDAEFEPLRGYDLAVVSELTKNTKGEGEVTDEKVHSRLVVLGSADFLYSGFLDAMGDQGSNLDLAMNAFNWLASREWRVNVSPKDPDLRFIPRDEIPAVSRYVLWGLPLLLLALGLTMAFVRSRGGPKAA